MGALTLADANPGSTVAFGVFVIVVVAVLLAVSVAVVIVLASRHRRRKRPGGYSVPPAHPAPAQPLWGPPPGAPPADR